MTRKILFVMAGLFVVITILVAYMYSRQSTISEIPSGCVRWSEIDPGALGQAICVYGNVAKIERLGNGKTNIYFSTQPNTFFLSSNKAVVLNVGDCIYTTHVLLAFGNMRYMEPSTILRC